MNKTYLAEKEKKIIDEAQKIIDFDINDFANDNESIAQKLSGAKTKVVMKMNTLTDYYKVWNNIKDIKYSQKDAQETMDKKIYDLIFKTYKEIEKLSQKFNEMIKIFNEFVKEKEQE